MKIIILTIGVLLSISLYGTDKTKCEQLFKSAIFNFYLENSCKFDKHVSSSIRKEFGDKGCTTLFSDADMKSLNNEVLGSSYKLQNKVGKENFCKENKPKYDKLGNIYK